MAIDGPTLLVSSVVAAAVTTTVMRATRFTVKRTGRTEDLPRLRLGVALVLFGVLLIGIAVRRVLVQ
jgi:hypothetical protein